MDHARFKANETAALYVSGDLDGATQEAFELHLMSCPSCIEDVELWRTMRAGVRAHPPRARAPAVNHWALTGQWPMAASLAAIAIGSGAVGWYARSHGSPALEEDAVAIFNLPPVTRGYEDCEPLLVDPFTELVALRIPNAPPGARLELTDSQGAPLPAKAHAMRRQADGSWLLRMRVEPLMGERLRLQSHPTNGLAEPVGCVVISRT